MRFQTVGSSTAMVAVCVVVGLVSAADVAGAQQRRLPGPVIESFGGRADVEAVGPLDFEAPTDREYKAVFELSEASPSPDRALPGLENIARYVNLHAAAGVPRENIKVAVVIHGGAVAQTMTHEAYRAANDGIDNPALERFQALADAGVQIYLCAQSAGFRGMTKSQMAAPLKLAYSAMTVTTLLQEEGYAAISHDWPRGGRGR